MRQFEGSFIQVVLFVVLIWFIYLSIEVARHVDAWPFS